MVNNVEVSRHGENSVNVSWDPLPSVIVNQYIVFYSQTGNRKRQTTESSIIVPSPEHSVVITELITGAEYQVQVVAQTMVDDQIVLGEKSRPKKVSLQSANATILPQSRLSAGE